jgi:molybdopterin/thiamine biosynthesis adenylyltransferase
MIAFRFFFSLISPENNSDTLAPDLAGIGDVTIIDDSIVSVEDLGCQFFLREQDVGTRTRATAAIENLQALNPLAKVHAESGEASSLTEDRH